MQGHNPGEKYLAHFTVTVHLAVFFPSVVVTVIVAVPFFFAVTTPLLEAVATLVLLLFHVTVLYVALLGATVAVNVAVLPTARVWLVLLSVTLVTAIGFFTVTVHVAVLLPSLVVTVIFAVPAAKDAQKWKNPKKHFRFLRYSAGLCRRGSKKYVACAISLS